MIDAQRVLLSFELSFARAITDHNQARIVLEKLTGEPLTKQPSIISQVEVSS
jgi:hypothetical protein